jgi:RNA polymerase sigma factor (sigma-70 family)
MNGLEDELVERCRAVARRMYRPDGRHSYADLVQVAIAEALVAARDHPGCTAAFVAIRAEWRIRDLYRRHYREVVSEEDVVVRALENQPAPGCDPYELLEQRELAARVSTLMRRARLTDKQRHVIALLYGGDFTEGEAARRMGVTVAVVKGLRHRALERLRSAA